MSNYSRIRAYLEAHPTPWRVEDIKARGELHEAIVDASGAVVLSSKDAESYQSVFAPDGAVEALVDFVNLVGEGYEPPCGWPGVDYGPIEPVDQHDLYEYGVTYTMRDGTEERIEWCEHTGDVELDRQIILSRVANWRKAGQNPKVVRRRVGQVEEEPPESWFERKPSLRPVD